jgi:hypothetical protein
MPRRRVLIFVLVAFLLAGCGSTEVPSRDAKAIEVEPRDAPRAAFVAEARRICTGLQRRLGARPKPAKGQESRFWLQLADAWAATIRELRTVDPPSEDRRRFERMLGHFDGAVRAARAVPRAGEMALVPIAGFFDQGGKGAAIAKSYGLLSCSLAPPAPTKRDVEQFRAYVEREAGALFRQTARLPRLKPRRSE